MQLSVFNQPYDLDGNVNRLGDQIIERLTAGHFDEFVVRVAFATRSGTSRIYEALQQFNASEKKSELVVGINNGVTTAQALEQLILAGSSVFALDSRLTLFHPKSYLFRNNASAWLSVGSSNLTGAGLFKNLETNIVGIADLADANQIAELDHIVDWPQVLQSMGAELFSVAVSDLEPLIAQGRLIDERIRKVTPSTSTKSSSKSGTQLTTPPLPPPAAVTGSILTPSRKAKTTKRLTKKKAAAVPVKAAPVAKAGIARYFAMTLSAFDCSHKTGTPGTPEISLPEGSVGFFPPVSMQGRKYPDAYFDVQLNKSPLTERVTYRIWQRPPGSGTGHADWRINIKHETMDLTSPTGGDIILFEKDFDEDNAPYNVWIVSPADPRYAKLLSNCTQETHARGAAGTKKYGIFA